MLESKQNNKSVTNAGQQHGKSIFFKPVIQPKLTINQPNDVYEQEADAVADKVMRMTDHETVQAKFFKPAISSVQRKCEHCEEEEKRAPVNKKNDLNPGATITFMTEGGTGTVDPETGVETITQSCCPLHEGELISSPDKFSVIDAGPLPVLGGTQARYMFEYHGATDSTAPCSCDCCSFVQFVAGFFEVNGTRIAHTLPGSGLPLSAAIMQQDSPILPHAGCRVATSGAGPLNDTPGLRGISPTDNLNVHLDFEARTIDTCNADTIVVSKFFTLDITGRHPRSFVASGDFG